MCEKCDLIDYPVADCWRPCYVPPRRSVEPRPQQRGLVPLWNDHTDELHARIRDLESENLKLQMENLRLQTQRHDRTPTYEQRPHSKPVESSEPAFKGIDVDVCANG